MSEKALRYNEGKPKWHLVHFESLEPLVRVLEMGAEKYEPFNWQKHFELEDLMDSLMRHVVAINKGEYVDEESKLLHIGHIMCNAMFWVYHYNKQIKEGFDVEAIKEAIDRNTGEYVYNFPLRTPKSTPEDELKPLAHEMTSKPQAPIKTKTQQASINRID